MLEIVLVAAIVLFPVSAITLAVVKRSRRSAAADLDRGSMRRLWLSIGLGIVIAFLGLGLFFGNWLSLAGLLVPVTLAVRNRVVKEEQALHAAFGDDYDVYCSRTKRFIPGLI